MPNEDFRRISVPFPNVMDLLSCWLVQYNIAHPPYTSFIPVDERSGAFVDGYRAFVAGYRRNSEVIYTMSSIVEVYGTEA